MSILFLSDSILTTVQDTGRAGFRALGVNPNGAMDGRAAQLINITLGNEQSEAVLEIHFPAPRILFEEKAIVALGGADLAAKIDDGSIENWRPYAVEKNRILSFSRKISGNRIYLSVRGGFAIENWLDSKSTNLKAETGGFSGRRLLKNDRIFFGAKRRAQSAKFDYFVSPQIIPGYSNSPNIRFIKGAEWENLTEKSRADFLSGKFSISQNSDRMGFRLKGAPLYLSEKLELVSSAVNFGTIQLTPDGQTIILMADHQTTGGYPRIAHVIAADLPLVAQLGAGDSLSFAESSIAEAETAAINFEKNLNLLRNAVKFKTRFSETV